MVWWRASERIMSKFTELKKIWVWDIKQAKQHSHFQLRWFGILFLWPRRTTTIKQTRKNTTRESKPLQEVDRCIYKIQLNIQSRSLSQVKYETKNNSYLNNNKSGSITFQVTYLWDLVISLLCRSVTIMTTVGAAAAAATLEWSYSIVKIG